MRVWNADWCLRSHVTTDFRLQDCTAWVTTADGKPDSSKMNCWLFKCVGATHKSADRVFGGATKSCSGPSPGPPPQPPQPHGDGQWWSKGVSTDYYLAAAPVR